MLHGEGTTGVPSLLLLHKELHVHSVRGLEPLLGARGKELALPV